MAISYQVDKKWMNTDFTITGFEKGEYENCVFINCNFHALNLSNYVFIDCQFIDSNLSTVSLNQTALRGITFKNCKLLGLIFDTCNDFLLALIFENCVLNHSSFYKRKLKKTVFKNTSLQEVDFSEADLSQAVFDNCDFFNATFGRTNLEKADLRTSYNYVLDPENNRIKKAQFSLSGLSGLLLKYDIVVA
ncbi:pentapeptide repeat-containing protein [Flectobacillus major]|uniref:pentapeptide repeat-containing protein n=1 Tax=Flectobacillus major TaxID=103 RepID=UPI0003FA0AEB|nr:pentapeptide repeat-containing protein [Flectobacillus major]